MIDKIENLIARLVAWLLIRPGYWVCKLLPRYRRQEPSDTAELVGAVVFWIVVLVVIGSIVAS